MKRNLVLFIFLFLLLSACGTSTPQPTPQLVNIYVSDAAYSWASGFYNCPSIPAVVNISDPQSAEINLRLGEPDNLTTPAYQISTEDILVIANRQSGADSLKLDQVRSLFIGQITNWKEVGGKDLPVQIWTFDSEEDIGGLFSKLVMNGQPVTSLARLATSAQVMQQAISSIPGSIGILPHSLLEGDTNVIYKVATVPVLAITKSVPQGVVRDLISCLQENH